ncbi:MAG: UDP-N-acetylmuramoyl-L-alanine--D-glutamate ligase [Pseudomonadota bacterium]|jgi:UDP-N-acetylmuramoylalanine--D-glutamate ligase
MSFQQTLNGLREQQKKVLVVGLGISGVESATFLSRAGLSVIVCERQAEALFTQKSKFSWALPTLRANGVIVHFGVDGEQVAPLLADVGLVVLSPGVPLESSVVGTVRRVGVPYVSELELGIELHGGPSVVVTGSNGKSTTVSLLAHILRHAHVKSRLCGNVGTPVISSEEILANGPREDRSVLVVEASSYQLEACTVLKPIISVVLNISENHLERHGTMERYAAAKGRALTLQDERDYTVVNADDQMVMSLARKSKGTRGVFGQLPIAELSKLSDNWAHIAGPATIQCRVSGSLENYNMVTSHLMGLHNRYNCAAVILSARRLGVSKELIQAGLDSFSPLEHRLEPVPHDGRGLVFNDSKSTTVAASLAAFITVRERYPNRPLIVMLGGLSKAGSWDPLLRRIQDEKEGVLPIICFGKDGPLLASHCKAHGLPCHIEPSLQAGTTRGMATLREAEDAILLLTPGCASFDEFSDFEHRGAKFKEYVTAAAR